MPAIDVIVQNNPNWADVAMVVLTGLLFVAATVAFWQVRQQVRLLADQIRLSESHHKEQLHASHQPVIVFQHVEALLLAGRSKETYLVGVALQNIGAGPALSVDIRGWARIVPDWATNEELQRSMESLRDEVDLDQPDIRLRVGGVAAGDPPRLLPMAGEVEIEGDFVGHGALLYIAEYTDLFKNQYPRVPRSEWRVGHAMVWPAGSWRMTHGG